MSGSRNSDSNSWLFSTICTWCPHVADGEPNQPRVGWQAKAAREVESSFLAHLRLTLSDAEGAMLRSQGGPLPSSPFISFPTNRTSRLEPHPVPSSLATPFPLPLSARACRCGRPLGVLGHHRSACAVVGTLGRRGFPLENAAARICREAGGRVRTNVLVRDSISFVKKKNRHRECWWFAHGQGRFPFWSTAVMQVLEHQIRPSLRVASERSLSSHCPD